MPDLRGQSVLFDFDGTLVDTAPSIARAFNTMLAERGDAAVEVTEIRQWVSLGADELVRRCMRSALTDLDSDLAKFRQILKTEPPNPDDLFPHVAACLSTLKARGLKMGVVTNKPEALASQQADLLGLSGYFDVLIGGDSLPRSKPDPETLFEALRRLDADCCLGLVGDSLVDCRTAHAAGLDFYLFEGGYGGAECPSEMISKRFSGFQHLADLFVQDSPIPKRHRL